MKDFYLKTNFKRFFSSFKSDERRRQGKPEAPIVVKYHPSKINDQFNSNNRVIKIKSADTFLEIEGASASEATRLAKFGYDMPDSLFEEVNSFYNYSRLMLMQDRAERESIIEGIVNTLNAYKRHLQTVTIASSINNRGQAYNYATSCLKFQSLPKYFYDDIMVTSRQAIYTWLNFDDMSKILLCECLQALKSEHYIMHKDIVQSFDEMMSSHFTELTVGYEGEFLIYNDREELGRELWSIYNTLVLFYTIPFFSQRSLMIEIILLVCIIKINVYKMDNNFSEHKINDDIAQIICRSLERLREKYGVREENIGWKGLLHKFVTADSMPQKAIKLKIASGPGLLRRWYNTKGVCSGSPHITRMAFCYAIAGAVNLQMLNCGFYYEHQAIFDLKMCEARIIFFDLMADSVPQRDCELEVDDTIHNRLYILTSNFTCFSIRCTNRDNWSGNELWENVTTDGGVYEKAYGVVSVLIIIGLLVVITPILLLVLQFKNTIELKFDVTSLGSWLAVLYGGVLVIIQNTWLEDWKWYDLIRARRLIQSLTDIKNEKDRELKKFDVSMTMLSSSDWVSQNFNDKNTCGNRKKCYGKTDIDNGITSSMFDWAGISTIQHKQTGIVFVEAESTVINNNYDELSEFWHKCTAESECMHISNTVQECVGNISVIFSEMEFRGIRGQTIS